MSDPRREAVASTLYRFVEGTMTDNRMPWPILCDLYPGTADHYRAMADETLTAIDAEPTPDPMAELLAWLDVRIAETWPPKPGTDQFLEARANDAYRKVRQFVTSDRRFPWLQPVTTEKI